MWDQGRTQNTWYKVSCAERVVASVCRVWTFRSNSNIYRAFLSFERAADCRFARILQVVLDKRYVMDTWYWTQIHPKNKKSSWWFGTWNLKNRSYYIYQTKIPSPKKNLLKALKTWILQENGCQMVGYKDDKNDRDIWCFRHPQHMLNGWSRSSDVLVYR